MYKRLFLLLIPCFLYSCVMDVPQQGDKNGTSVKTKAATVSFFNETSYQVELYKNVNPPLLDTDTQPLLTLPSGKTGSVELPPSAEQAIGDTFYIRYAAMLDNGETNGGRPVYARAKRDISNLTFVIKSGESYSKKIQQPPREQLVFPYAYLKFYNAGTADIQLIYGTSILKNLGAGTVNIKSSTVGVYALELPDVQEALTVSNMKVYITALDKYVPVAAFTVKSGNCYTFTYSGVAVRADSIIPLVK